MTIKWYPCRHGQCNAIDNLHGTPEITSIVPGIPTRSDIYTAYVVIRVYPAGDSRKGPVESKRLFVVFDRSKITDTSDRVQILGYYEFD